MSKPNSPAGAPAPAARNWVPAFLRALAETSNVARAARLAGVSTATVYETRRKQSAFARKWREALCEGYDNLEMELLGRLREGEIKPAAQARRGVRGFDNAIALRLLAAHRESAERQRALRATVTAAELRASINRKIEAVRARIEAEQAYAARNGDAQTH